MTINCPKCHAEDVLKAQLRAAEERIANLEDRDALLRDAVMWFNFHRPVWTTGDNKFPPWFVEAKALSKAEGESMKAESKEEEAA